jgi:hypothetical protein
MILIIGLRMLHSFDVFNLAWYGLYKKKIITLNCSMKYNRRRCPGQEGCHPGARSATKHQLSSRQHPARRACRWAEGVPWRRHSLSSCCNDGQQIHFRRGSSPSKPLLAEFKCKVAVSIVCVVNSIRWASSLRCRP